MKGRLTVAFSVSVLSCVCALAANPTIRIMPLGDSITYGSGSTGGGYRAPLYTLLTNANFNVDYVGTQTGNPTNTLPDSDHEGHGGWWISNTWGSGLYENVLGWFKSILDPHIVLLHIGTNDSGDPSTFTNTTERAVDRLDKLVTRIVEYQPSARIIVTTLMIRNEPNYSYITNSFNPYVEGKVKAQQALGRHVYFLDMNNYLTLDDMNSDTVHPHNGGYAKMAEAWFTAITNIVPDPSAVWTNQTVVLTNSVASDRKSITVYYNTAMDAGSATNLANYTLGAGLTPVSASISSNKKNVTITLASAAEVGMYSLAISGVKDETGLYTVTGYSAKMLFPHDRGAANNVPASEFKDYSLIYAVDLPLYPHYKVRVPTYTVDYSARTPAFSRVAYYLELQKTGEDVQYIWVSMDAFTKDAGKLGIPVRACDTVFQQYVNNLHVWSDVDGVVSGSKAIGNIEFWPWNYTQPNAKNIPGASSADYDFGDACNYSGDHGSMQVHDTANGTALFCINRWGKDNDSESIELGIGPSYLNKGTYYSKDWTMAGNGGTYSVRTLQVYVKCDGGNAVAPTVLSAVRGISRTMVQVTFSTPVLPGSVKASAFTLSSGSILSATLLPDCRVARLVTTEQPEGDVTLTVSGIREGSAAALEMKPATLTLQEASIPAEVAANAGSLADGYDLIYSLDIPIESRPFNDGTDFYRYNDNGYWKTFDRIGYYYELVSTASATSYVWVSMDAFTNNVKYIGVPVRANGVLFQQYVANLDVKSSVSAITSGTAMAGGNIEFGYGNYGGGNNVGIPNANTSVCDFGDELQTSGDYGCMQVHNYAARQTIFAFNQFGKAYFSAMDLGIGNRADTNPDWTFSNNSITYKKRTLHVFVRPSATDLQPSAEVVDRVPDAANYQHLYTIDLPVSNARCNIAASNALYYTVNNFAKLSGSFSRVAYFFALVPNGSTETQWVWTAMSPFTKDASLLGIPGTNTQFQAFVKDLDVSSNVAGVSNVTGLAMGNVEFTYSNYGGGNSKGVPGADNTAFDFGDSFSYGSHGCMQIHNFLMKQTIFAINNLNSGTLAVGIGNSNISKYNSLSYDWTFADNAGSYSVRRLYVFIQPGSCGSDFTAPALKRATASRDLSKIAVLFTKQMDPSAADPAAYSVSGNVTVKTAELSKDGKYVILGVSPLTASTSYTVTLTKFLADASDNRNIAPIGIFVGFTSPAATYGLPSIYKVGEIGEYELVYAFNVPLTGNNISAYGCTYDLDNSPFLDGVAFDRIAYCLDLVDTNNVEKGVFVSMDAFSSEVTKIGLPSVERGTILFQQKVANMNVYAWTSDGSKPAVTTGTGIQTGNIEIWPGNYGGNNGMGIPDASGSTYDFGDSSDINSANAGHGCLQIHNWGAKQTILSFSHTLAPYALGIGNNPKAGCSDPDWTVTYNASDFLTRTFYVLIRKAKKASNALTYTRGTAPTFILQPLPAAVRKPCGSTVTLYCNSDATYYQWRRNGIPVLNGDQAILTIPNARTSDSGTYDVIAYKNIINYGTSSQVSTVEVYEQGTVIMLK